MEPTSSWSSQETRIEFLYPLVADEIPIFYLFHFKLWNLREYSLFKKVMMTRFNRLSSANAWSNHYARKRQDFLQTLFMLKRNVIRDEFILKHPLDVHQTRNLFSRAVTSYSRSLCQFFDEWNWKMTLKLYETFRELHSRFKYRYFCEPNHPWSEKSFFWFAKIRWKNFFPDFP